MVRLPRLAPLLALGACATPSPGLHLGERARLDGVTVTPLRVVSDSRCPVATTCVWAGTVVVDVRVDTGSSPNITRLTLGRPLRVANRMLELIAATPAPLAGQAIPLDRYRFTFRVDDGR